MRQQLPDRYCFGRTSAKEAEVLRQFPVELDIPGFNELKDGYRGEAFGY